MNNQRIWKRKKARQLALQALYQWQLTKTPLDVIEQEFSQFNNMKRVDRDYFSTLLQGVVSHLTEIDAAFVTLLDRKIEALNPVELAVLRMGTYELLFCKELPYRVILDEMVSLTKLFGAEAGYRYVNGILDPLARRIRASEYE